MNETIPDGMFRCTGIILDGPLKDKPCQRLIRRPSAKVPVKHCPRCHTEHVYQRTT